MSAFGANEWLVEEMHERFQKDPNSVDKVWWDFFDKDHPAQGTASSETSASSSTTATATATRTSNGSGHAVTESTGAPKRGVREHPVRLAADD